MCSLRGLDQTFRGAEAISCACLKRVAPLTPVPPQFAADRSLAETKMLRDLLLRAALLVHGVYLTAVFRLPVFAPPPQVRWGFISALV